SPARSATNAASTWWPATRPPAATARIRAPAPTRADAGGPYRPSARRRLRARLRRAAGAYLQPPGTLLRRRTARRPGAARRRGGGQAPLPPLCPVDRGRSGGPLGASRPRAPGAVRVLDLRGRSRIHRRPCDRRPAPARRRAGGGERGHLRLAADRAAGDGAAA